MTDILHMAFYRAIEVRENDLDYLILAQSTVPPTCCPACQSLEYNKHGTREPVFMDIPIHGKRVGIKVIRQRYRCKSCSNVFIDPLIGMNEIHMMTARLVKFIQEESIKRTFTSIAEDVGVDERVIRNIFRDYIKVQEATYKPETPEWLGIDEIHLVGNPRCVLTNVRERTLIDMLKTRTKPVVVDYLLKMPDRQRIQVVTMDMWQPYREAVEACLPQAKIVVDRYHVVRMANKGLDECRKALKAGMTTTQRRQLMRDRYVLLKRKKDLEAKDLLLLSTWLDNIPTLKIAYELKEMFCDIYELPDKKQAMDKYDTWRDTLSANSNLELHFEELTTAMGNWREPIFNYFDFQITNAYTESMNSLIKIANRIGRGYSFEVIRAKMLFRNGHEQKPKFKDGGRFLRDISANLYLVGRQPDNTEPSRYLGVPITTLKDMIEHHEL